METAEPVITQQSSDETHIQLTQCNIWILYKYRSCFLQAVTQALKKTQSITAGSGTFLKDGQYG